MGEKWDKIKEFSGKFGEKIILFLVLVFIIHSDKEIRGGDFTDLPENIFTILSIFFITLLFVIKGYINKLGDTPMLLVYGLYIITIYGYTFYQWNVSSKKTDKECSITIPRTKNFSKSQYYLYRIMYITTIIVIVVLIW